MNSKITAFLMLCCAATFQKASAQNADDRIVSRGTSHFYLGYGTPNGLARVLSGDDMLYGPPSSTSSFGPITATYQYAVAKGFTIGAQFNYSSAKSVTSMSFTDPLTHTTTSAEFRQAVRIYNIDARADYHYLKGNRFDIYTGLILGYDNIGAKMETTPGMGFDLDVSLGGLTVGAHTGLRYMLTQNIGLFAEGTFRLYAQEGMSDFNQVAGGPSLNGGISFATRHKKVTMATPAN